MKSRRDRGIPRGRATPTAHRFIPPATAISEPPKSAKALATGEPYAWRLRTDVAAARAGTLSWHEDGTGPDGENGTVTARPELWGDFVVARKDVPTSYHLAVVVDDAIQGVTHVVRGRDLFHATAAHVLLQALLGLPRPIYHHHRLITDDRKKLSKSDRATSLRSLREGGATPADIRRMIGIDVALASPPG